jgi:hypothetical protein
MGLGDVGKVGLGLARRKRDDQHRLRGEGKDPLAERRAEKGRKKAGKIPPFRVLAEQYIRTNIDMLGGRAQGQWRQSLTALCLPGHRRSDARRGNDGSRGEGRRA